ncbi:MAG: thioredoxin family protein [Sphingopyxis sp.]
MTRKIALAFAALLLPLTPVSASEDAPLRSIPGVAEPYETTAFDPDADAMAAVDAALHAARRSGKRVLLVMGANDCHDSAWLANAVTSADLAAALATRYHIVFVDIGMPQVGRGRNPEIPTRFGFRKIKGTPTVAILDARGHVLNRKAAPKWRNAASRNVTEIQTELMQ